MPKSCLLFISPMLFLSWQANADDFFDETWYASGMVSYIDDDKDRDVDDGLSGYQLGLGKDLNTVSSVEFKAIGAFFNADGFDADQQQWGLGVDYVGRFAGTEFFTPYVVVGGGYIKSQNKDPRKKDDGGPMASVGVGILTPLNVFGMKLRTEFRLRFDNSVGIRRDYLLSFGLHRAIKAKPALVSDSDGDGVADPGDRCGNTMRNTAVDRYGCARTRDEDRDGVADDEDRCGSSPQGTEVDKYGCKRSDDGQR